MAFGPGRDTVSYDEILSKTTEAKIISYYLGVYEYPILINSPLRRDTKPSFGLYSPNGYDINYIDFANKERGSTLKLLSKLWCLTIDKTLQKLKQDLPNFTNEVTVSTNPISITTIGNHKANTDLQCRVREWRDYDEAYWQSYGIPLDWVKYADVHPISHIIVVKDGQKHTFTADKYAYAYVERKEGKITLKIYQPFNTKGFKWSNKHDKSVISLWTKIPETGDKLCICSSLKDALCLWCNTGIPAVAIQGEGYAISNTAINELKRRYKNVYILLDNDKPGLEDGEKLASSTGFKNLVLPNINEAKDVSDLYKSLQDKNKFKTLITNLFK